MIKAQAAITLASIRDVLAVVRFYMTQASASDAPAKPTVYPAPAPWSTTEPGYTEATKLYTVDCTVFSDGTWIYSEVSLSSAYEAGKVAVEKVIEAEANIELLSDRITQTVTVTETQAAEISDIAGRVDGVYETVLDDEGQPVQATDENGDPLYDEEGAPIYEQIYVPGIKDAINDLESDVDAVNENLSGEINDLKTEHESVESQFSSLEQTVNDFSVSFGKTQNDIQAWFTFTDEGELEIGQSDSPVVSRQTNESYAFVEEATGKELLRLDTDGATADTLNANEIKMPRENSNWVWREGTNGNLNLVWIGG